nr:PDZ domain-containing protein [Calditrichia bacterium]
DPEKKKETELGQINGYEISADHKKMLVSSSGSYAIIDLPKSKIDMKDKLDLSNMEVNLDRKSEWKQIYHEAWRQMRDFFYAPNMHGVDWVAMRDRYAPLVEHVHHRDDLTYIMGELMGELNVGHAYVGGGERPSAPRLSMGLLGAEMSRDASGYFRIDKILSGENWDNGSRSPLTELGVGVSEGDYILAINGQPVDKMNNIYQGLINTAGKEIFLTVNSKPNSTGSREVLVKPLRDESGLYYYNWVRKNIEYVNKKTNGKVGYIHIPDMGVNGLNEFVKHYYPQLSKKALIVDVRGNGGGNVSPMIIERLRREVAMIDISRNVAPSLDPGGQIWGPMVCLVNEYSASDGDLFTYRFKKHKLGTVIGKRSWGGTVGIRGSLPLLDGGSLTKPEFSRYDEAGKEWIIEGYGVDPDIEVINDPATEFKGVDQQLDKAIEVITGQMKTDGKQIPPAPPYPVR